MMKIENKDGNITSYAPKFSANVWMSKQRRELRAWSKDEDKVFEVVCKRRMENVLEEESGRELAAIKN